MPAHMHMPKYTKSRGKMCMHKMHSSIISWLGHWSASARTQGFPHISLFLPFHPSWPSLGAEKRKTRAFIDRKGQDERSPLCFIYFFSCSLCSRKEPLRVMVTPFMFFVGFPGTGKKTLVSPHRKGNSVEEAWEPLAKLNESQKKRGILK